MRLLDSASNRNRPWPVFLFIIEINFYKRECSIRFAPWEEFVAGGVGGIARNDRRRDLRRSVLLRLSKIHWLGPPALQCARPAHRGDETPAPSPDCDLRGTIRETLLRLKRPARKYAGFDGAGRADSDWEIRRGFRK